MATQQILTETGTNEMEIAEFTLFGQSFGVNVLKIREFLPYEGLVLTPLAGSHSAIKGVFMLRNNAIPIVQLDSLVDLQGCEKKEAQVVMVTQFNKITVAFAVDGIKRIHRASWSQFQPVHPIVDHGCVVGTLQLDNCDVLILDLEHITGQVFPASIVQYNSEEPTDNQPSLRREKVRMLFAEDSSLIRGKVNQIFAQSGYANVESFVNGLDAMKYIENLVRQCNETQEDIKDTLNVIVSDIEMPQLDGLSLCRRVKQELKLDIPVVLFSSLISEQTAIKCDAVGADCYVAKPETDELLRLIDSHVGIEPKSATDSA